MSTACWNIIRVAHDKSQILLQVSFAQTPLDDQRISKGRTTIRRLVFITYIKGCLPGIGGGGTTTMIGWQTTDDLGVSNSLLCQIHHRITLTNVRNTFSLLLILTSAASRIQLSDRCCPSPWVPCPAGLRLQNLFGVLKIGILLITVPGT